MLINHHRSQPGNYHADGLRLLVTDNFGNAVYVPYPSAWCHPEFETDTRPPPALAARIVAADDLP